MLEPQSRFRHYRVADTVLPYVWTPIGVFSLTILTNAVLIGIAYPVVLWQVVSHKTLRISKTFGIEGQKLLSPDDDFEALKNFNHQYEGEATQAEKCNWNIRACFAPIRISPTA